LSPDRLRELLTPALEGVPWEHVVRDIEANEAQVWIEGGSAMVTELWNRDDKPDCLHVWLAGGNLKDLLTLRPKVEEQARAWGFNRITIAGRLGWDRVLKRFGYVRRDNELEKVL
jgi:hypothetical protein